MTVHNHKTVPAINPPISPVITPDDDPQETQEWRDALTAVIHFAGPKRAQFLLETLVELAHHHGADLPFSANTPYVNTIPLAAQPPLPGDDYLEWRLRSMIRWNAMAMVVRANKQPAEPGGHIATFASSATLYDVGFNHFWRAPKDGHLGDFIYFQGHAAPGIYARAFLEGRLSETQLDHFRRELGGEGLSSYPHPWLMPDFWQFPTVSMGLGPLMAIYQARFMKYLEHRGLIQKSDSKVWAFLGDGETDEPESLGAISLAAREKLDNLIFVVNCNLQRLDGPVRGNGKIIQELEANFRGAGWQVIKVIWGSKWDDLLAKDQDGWLRKRMEECLDGEYQNYKAKGGAYTREHFFGKYPELRAMVDHLSDEAIWRLDRGGHDPKKIYAAYAAAVQSSQPTVILAKTVKGYGMGEAGEGMNMTHQQKKLGETALKHFRDRFRLPIPDEAIHELPPFYKPAAESLELAYLHQRREALGGYLPQRRRYLEAPLAIPELSRFDLLLHDTGERQMSTTMAVVRLMAMVGRDPVLGPRLVPIIPDEARTFGMEGLFRQLGIYAHEGQKYTPQDADQIMPYREDYRGQMLQEGINEAGAMSSWIAAATAYANYGVQMLPIYLFYSMFGFQRIGDLAWAAGDARARGFLIGGTSGRTTLNGEGLQHQDGHSQVLAQCIPNCVSYDPTFHYEVAVIFRQGLMRLLQQQEDVYFYLTTLNENYRHPEMPVGVESQIIQGMYRLPQFSTTTDAQTPALTVQLLGSGAILREVIAAAALLQTDFGILADVWSVTSFNELARDGHEAHRWNRLHPNAPPRIAFVEQQLGGTVGPIIAASDYLRLFAEQVRPFMSRPYVTLGTDGFGRSDSRAALRDHFEVDRRHIAYAAIRALCDGQWLPTTRATEALARYEIAVHEVSALRR